MLLFMLVAMLPVVVFAVGDHGDHADLHKCDLCDCFVKYEDCDLWDPLEPYAVADNPYTTTLDQCLGNCLNDPSCTGVVHGLVGGRHWYTCEQYNKPIIPARGLGYIPQIDTYYKRQSMPCRLDFAGLRSKLNRDQDRLAAIVERKKTFAAAYAPGYPNPLFGRNRR